MSGQKDTCLEDTVMKLLHQCLALRMCRVVMVGGGCLREQI